MKVTTAKMVVVVVAAVAAGREERVLLGRPIHRWNDNINIVPKELEWEEGG
jgi:hypothetical protein